MKLSETVYRRLTLVNSVILLLAALGVLIVAIAKREAIIYRFNDIVEKEELSSQAVNIAKRTLSGAVTKAEFPLFELAVNPKYLREIEHFVQSAGNNGVLTKNNKKWYPARFHHNGQNYDIRIRIRGDLSNHWKNPKKSFRIKFKGGRYFNGYRAINLVVPEDKRFEIEPVALEKARSMGLLVPDSGFVRVKLNQVDMGLYYWFEQPDKNMLERLRYPQGEMFTADGIWMDTRAHRIGVMKEWDLYAGSFQSSVHKGNPTAGMIQERWERLLELAREADAKTFAGAVRHLVDLDKFVKWNALTWLFGGSHAQIPDDVRWYYDTSTGLFEPITYDLQIFEVFHNRKAEGSFDSDPKHLNPLVQKILRDPEITRRRNEVLYRLIGDDGESLVARMDRVYEEIRADLGKGVGSFRLESMDELHQIRKDIFKDNLELLRAWLEYGRVFVESAVNSPPGPARLTLRVFPDSLADLRLRRIVLKPHASFPRGMKIARMTLSDPAGRVFPLSPVRKTLDSRQVRFEFDGTTLRSGRDDTLFPRVTKWLIAIEFEGITPEALQNESYPSVEMDFVHALTDKPIETFRVRGSPTSIASRKASGGDPELPLEAFLSNTSLPLRLEGGNLVLAGGTYEVPRDIVIPALYGLVLEAGVILKMGPRASILCYRAIHIRGTASEQVRIEPLDEDRPWGVLGVSNAKQLSTIEYLSIRGGSEKWVNGIFFSGELNFYRSPVHISHSVIGDGRADDGLNIKHTKFEINDTRFEDNVSDGFDGDWITGVIRDAIFANNGGDGLDFSGSAVAVLDTVISGAGDKGISVGERTTLHALNVRISGSATGIASKDLSSTHVFASALTDNRIGVSLYRKKPLFGGGSMEILGSLLWRNEKDFTLDGESSLRLVGVGLEKEPTLDRIEGEDLRIGDIGGYYLMDKSGNPVLREGNGGIFVAGPKTESKTVLGITLPNLADGPVGMRRPLESSP